MEAEEVTQESVCILRYARPSIDASRGSFKWLERGTVLVLLDSGRSHRQLVMDDMG